MIRSVSRFASTSHIRNGNWSCSASLPNRLVQAKRFFFYPGIRQFYLDVQLNGKPQLQYFYKSMLAHMSIRAPFFCLNGKKIYVTPPPPCFFYDEKNHSFPNATSCETRAWWCSETRSAKV